MASEYQVTLEGIDVTKWVHKLSTTPLLKPEWGQIPSLKNMSIVMRSDDFMFTPTHPVSILFGVELNDIQIIVREFGQIVWRGTIADTQMDLKTYRCTLVCETFLQKQLNQIARIDTDLLTPAEIARNLLALYDVPFDNVSFSKAIDILDDIPCRVRLNPSVLEWDGTLGDILQTLATAGMGRFYVTANGDIGMDSYRLDQSPTTVIEINDEDLLQWVNLKNENMNKIEGYDVQGVHQPYTFGTKSKRKSFNYGAESSVVVQDETSGRYIGETWITLSSREYQRLDIFVRKNIALVVELGSWIQFNSKKIGLNQPAEIIGIDNSDERWVKFIGRIDKAVA